MVAALGNKAIDGATLLEPFITFATARNVGVRWKGMEDFLPFTGQNGVIIYSQKFAQEQPEPAKRWMAAYLKGTRAYLDSVINGTDRDGINAILAKYTAVKDLALLAKMAPTGFDPNGRMEIKSLEADRTGSSSSACSRDAPTSARSSTINTWITRWRGWASAERTRASLIGSLGPASVLTDVRGGLSSRDSPWRSTLYKTLRSPHGRANTVP
jgi:hypothetical protein